MIIRRKLSCYCLLIRSHGKFELLVRFKGCIIQTVHLESYSSIDGEYTCNRDIDKYIAVRVRLFSFAYEKVKTYLRMKVNFVDAYLNITDILVHVNIPNRILTNKGLETLRAYKLFSL